ncbi:carbohydrate-binding module family 13 protein [Rhizophagus clarus]|uniref:Carbohydrate-binding module family 13 protein n=1 Tax=Rhizophagus clarus TaxID=94130 RepID=A0A8H3QL48_9GLOM|nr:carbohydrate-binding module family 13 protein [Rhizophagus clarus]
MADNKFLPKLSQNLLEILDDEEYYDVTIEKNDGSLTHIKLPNILPEIFQIILKYIYGGKLSLEEYDASYIVKILIAANELSLQELIPHSQSFLIENQANWIEQNFIAVYQTSFENDCFLVLQKFCTELMTKQPEKFFNSPDFTSIPEKTLVSLIQRDNFQMNGIQVWEYVLKWGLAQNSGLPSDPKNFSKDDFNVLKNTLHQCIPFIKFFSLSSKEFLDRVLPYKKVLPKELYKELLKIFLNHDYRPTEHQTISEDSSSKVDSNKRVELIPKVDSISIDSKIITSQHAELISKWIDRLGITDEAKNLYEFKLILRASQNNYVASSIFDDKSNTVIIIKVKDSDEILGGYNPIKWNSVGFGTTNNSFIFSFMNNKNIEDSLLSRVKDKEHAINYREKLGSFGESDLILYGNYSIFEKFWSYSKGSCEKISYEKPIRKTKDTFDIERYEVFQIIFNCK